MQTKLFNNILNKTVLATFLIICPIALLGLGFFLGWKAENFSYSNTASGYLAKKVTIHNNLSYDELLISESFQFILLIGLLMTIFLIWTLILLAKSHQDRKAIIKVNKSLNEEIAINRERANELHITHQQLSTATGQLEGIFEGSTDSIVAIDTDYNYFSLNQSFIKHMKELFDKEVRQGMSIDDALEKFPEKIKEAKSLWTKALTGETFTADQYFSPNLEKTFYFESTYTPIKNSKGEIIGASQICRDVTQRKITSDNLKRERDFASAIFDINSSLIIVIDREGRIIRFNKACEKVSGYKEKEVKGRIFWNILLPTEDIVKIKQSFQNIEFKNQNNEYVNRWITKDEEFVYISWQSSFLKNEIDSDEYIVFTGIDITEKKKLEKTKNRMLEILENSSDLIRISDLQGRVIYLNKAGKQMLGLADETILTNLRIHSFHPTWVNELVQSEGLPQSVKNGTWLGETAIKTVNNEEIPTSQLILSHKNKTGELEYFSTVARDISKLKKMEQDLESARDIAIETNRKKSEFLAHLAHEIRTPMNGIIGISELLQNSDLSDDQKEYANIINNSGYSILRMINNILDFSKLEAGKLQIENINFNLCSIIESIFDIFAKQLSQKGLEFCFILNKDVPTNLIGDPGRLKQILTNLISNAIKFSEKGEIVLRISLEENKKKPMLKFSISDTGIGISEENQKKLFEDFSQADPTISRRFGGTGLGLSISKKLVSMMSGEIGFKSKIGKGSIFWFTTTFDFQTLENQVFIDEDKLTNTRILIIDNNKTHKNFLLNLTKSWGMLADESVTCKNALKLLEVAAQNGEPFEIVILNIKNTKMDSLDFINKFNQEPTRRNTKIVLLHYIDNNELIENAKTLGITDFVSKPVKHTVLFNTLVKATAKDIQEKSLDDSKIIFVQKPTFPDKKNKDFDFIINEKNYKHLPIIKDARILIAEDNLVNQKVILNQVSGLGYEVDLVANGQRVLDYLQLQDYSLILMDSQMPIMDGLEATINIRKSEKGTNNHIPIIAVTAHVTEESKEKCLSFGMDDYISKPTRQDDLAEKIAYWINKNNPNNIGSKLIENPSIVQTDSNNLSEIESIDLRLNDLSASCSQEIVLDCINLFLIDTKNLINILKKSHNKSNFLKLARDAHKLKGSSSNMGAITMPKLCQKLIASANNNKIAATQIFLNKIIDEFEFLESIYEEKKKVFQNKKIDKISVS